MGARLLTARIRLIPGLKRLVGLFEISRHLALEYEVDKKLLPVADSIPQLPGFGGAFSRQHRLPNITISQAQIRICHRELGIDFDGTAEKRDGGGAPGR